MKDPRNNFFFPTNSSWTCFENRKWNSTFPEMTTMSAHLSEKQMIKMRDFWMSDGYGVLMKVSRKYFILLMSPRKTYFHALNENSTFEEMTCPDSRTIRRNEGVWASNGQESNTKVSRNNSIFLMDSKSHISEIPKLLFTMPEWKNYPFSTRTLPIRNQTN